MFPSSEKRPGRYWKNCTRKEGGAHLKLVDRTLDSAFRFRAIGVSNYEVSHLKELMSYATVKPMVNQFEVHPRFPNLEVRQFCKEQGALLHSLLSLIDA